MAVTVELRSLAFGSIGGAYAVIGTAFTIPCAILYIQNMTDESLMFSFDGVNDHFPIPMYGYLYFDISQNKTKDKGLFTEDNFHLYVKQLNVPSLGSVYVTGFN